MQVFIRTVLTGALLTLILFCVSVNHAKSLAQDIGKALLEQGQPLTLPATIGDIPRNGEYAEKQLLDLDGDGNVDLAIEWTTGRGPLSTCYSSFRVATRGHAMILKGGAPLDPGEEISLLDLLNGVSTAPLCSVGSSLRFPDRSYEDFSGGAWWGTERRPLGVAIVQDGNVMLGYVTLSVSKQGEVKVEGTHLVKLTPAKVVAPGAAASNMTSDHDLQLDVSIQED